MAKRINCLFCEYNSGFVEKCLFLQGIANKGKMTFTIAINSYKINLFYFLQTPATIKQQKFLTPL